MLLKLDTSDVDMKQNILAQIHDLLLKKEKTVSTAESCTGGKLCEMLTSLPGSSKYLILGIIAYSNKAKTTLLKIPKSLILKKGAVSYEIADRMAQSARILGKSDFGIGITGIAGPTGATLTKPVGTVFIAIDSKNKKFCERFNFKGKRDDIRKQAAIKTLELLKLFL